MRSPAYALTWEIWSRHRATVVMIAASTLAGRLLEPSPLVELLWMVSFLLLFGVFTSGFPRRFFTLPVSSLRLVAVPLLAGVASVELLNLVWLGRLLTGTTSAWFVAVLLGALMVFHQAALWMLERAGPLRFVIAGGVAVFVFGIGIVPSFPPTPPSPWRSEAAMTALVAALTIGAFLQTWSRIDRLRSGGGSTAPRVNPLHVLAATRLSWTPKAFRSPAAAHFWFEWRCSGLVLPTLVGGVLVAVLAPLSWLARDDGGRSFQLLLGTIATPIVLAIPVGMAFSRPTLWSEDLSLPAFVAVRPMTDEDIVAGKVTAATASVTVSWLLVCSFLVVWLPLWANLDSISSFAVQLWAFHGHSVAAVFGIAALVVVGAMLLTWRLMVCRLWSGLSGSRALFVASVMSVVVAVIAWLVFDGTRFPRWVLEEPARMTLVAWTLSIAVICKYVLAAWSWRHVSPRYARQALLTWTAGTACFLVLAMAFWGVARIYVALDVYSFQAVMILSALLVQPLGRLGLAPSRLARNRHR